MINFLSNNDNVSALLDSFSLIANKQNIFSCAKKKIQLKSDKNSYVYFLRSGSVNIHRASDDIVVLTLTSPAIIGLTTIFNDLNFHYIQTVEDSELFAIERSIVVKHIDDNNLWRCVCEVFNAYMLCYFHRDEVVSSPNVYGIIKNLLEILDSFPHDVKSELSVFNFILDRANISRSSLNKIIKALSEGGYIDINRGRLISIKKLPSRF